jgi:hypothetical protein
MGAIRARRVQGQGIPHEEQQPVRGVYRLDPRDGAIIRLIEDFEGPNGLCLAEDGAVLFKVSGLTYGSCCFQIGPCWLQRSCAVPDAPPQPSSTGSRRISAPPTLSLRRRMCEPSRMRPRGSRLRANAMRRSRWSGARPHRSALAHDRGRVSRNKSDAPHAQPSCTRLATLGSKPVPDAAIPESIDAVIRITRLNPAEATYGPITTYKSTVKPAVLGWVIPFLAASVTFWRPSRRAET